MTIYELAIAVVDEPEAHRKKAGDIIAVRKHPWNWGRREIDAYLIVLVDLPDTIDGISTAGYLTSPLFEGNKSIIEVNTELNALPEDDPHDVPPVIDKNAFSIPITKLMEKVPDLALDRIQDKTRIYQPFKAKDQLLTKFDGQEGRHTIPFDLEDDTKTPTIPASTTKVLQGNDVRDLVYSKKDTAYRDLRKI